MVCLEFFGVGLDCVVFCFECGECGDVEGVVVIGEVFGDVVEVFV